MMKKCLSIVAMLLAVVMIAMCCAACGSDSGKSGIVGKWTTELDFDKVLAAAQGQGAGADELTQLLGDGLAGLKMKMFITFNDDGTFVLAGDKDSVDAASEKLKAAMTSALSAMGLSQEMIDESIKEMDLSQIVDGKKGKYELDGSKLYLYEEKKDDNSYLEIELSDKELKVVKVQGDNSDIPESLLPLVLTKD